MQKDINVPVAAIINDLDALIAEIDQNPCLSPWVVRLVLKSIKDKARDMVYEIPFAPVSPNKTAHLEAICNSSVTSKSRTRVLG